MKKTNSGGRVFCSQSIFSSGMRVVYGLGHFCADYQCIKWKSPKQKDPTLAFLPWTGTQLQRTPGIS